MTFEDHIKACIKKAELIYNISLGHVEIKYNIRTNSTIVGQASMSGDSLKLRFQRRALENHYEYMVKETIPHEVAHLVTYVRPDLGCSHDTGWKAICQALGGEGRTYHDLKNVVKTYQYVSDTGAIVDLSIIRHNKLQKGKVISYSVRGLGVITKNDFQRVCG